MTIPKNAAVIFSLSVSTISSCLSLPYFTHLWILFFFSNHLSFLSFTVASNAGICMTCDDEGCGIQGKKLRGKS